MKQNNLWKFLFVVFIVGWSFVSMYPPASSSLVKVFASRGENQDATFSNIGPMSAAELRELAKQLPVAQGNKAIA